MNQEQNNLNQNNFNNQGNNGIPDNQPLQNNQNVNVNQPIYDNQQQFNPNYEQPINKMNMESQMPINNSNENNKKFLIIIIAIIILILIFVIVFFVINNNNNKKAGNPVNNTPNVSEKNDKDNEEKEEDNFDINNWGVQESIVAENGENISTAYIKFPSLAGIIRGTGKIAYQTDKTLVILDSQRMSGSPEVTNDNILPAYFEQTKKIMERYRRNNYSGFDFSIDKQQSVKINDYDMIKYEGTHTYTFEGNPESIKFVAYSTKLKANNACIYWMVLDESEGQLLSETILEYAENMAYTLHE